MVRRIRTNTAFLVGRTVSMERVRSRKERMTKPKARRKTGKEETECDFCGKIVTLKIMIHKNQIAQVQASEEIQEGASRNMMRSSKKRKYKNELNFSSLAIVSRDRKRYVVKIRPKKGIGTGSVAEHRTRGRDWRASHTESKYA